MATEEAMTIDDIQAYKLRGHHRICLACEKPFEYGGTLPNQKGFCSKECYKEARELYIYEEKQKLRVQICRKYRYRRWIGKWWRTLNYLNRYMKQFNRNPISDCQIAQAQMKWWRTLWCVDLDIEDSTLRHSMSVRIFRAWLLAMLGVRFVMNVPVM